jgi:hypothetical protein
MLHRVLALALAGALAIPTAVFAQEEAEEDDNGSETFVVSSFKCDYNAIGDIDDNWNNEGQPIAQELVDEGMIMAAGVYYHQWGDDYNVHFWTVAEDAAAAIAASDEANSRAEERYPDGFNIFDHCMEHKDAFYTLGKSTEGDDNDEDEG